jgi:hypothetical protein
MPGNFQELKISCASDFPGIGTKPLKFLEFGQNHKFQRFAGNPYMQKKIITIFECIGKFY